FILHTDKTHGGGFETLDFSLVHAGGLCLCSSELYSPKTFQTSSYIPRVLPMRNENLIMEKNIG
ncbi:MAG: hypothetical protein ACKPFK_29855, partial [Dolichospermum sp.]